MFYITQVWPVYHVYDAGLDRQGACGPSSEKKNSSLKSIGATAGAAGGSGGRRSSASVQYAAVNTQSLGSNYASAASGSSSGGKRSLYSGGSIDSSSRNFGGLTKQMNILLRTRSESGKRLPDEVRKLKLNSIYINQVHFKTLTLFCSSKRNPM